MTVIAVEHIMKRLEKGAEDKIRQLSEAREKMNDGGESISHYLVDLERKVWTYVRSCHTGSQGL